jgi:hypothetical protein
MALVESLTYLSSPLDGGPLLNSRAPPVLMVEYEWVDLAFFILLFGSP